MTTARSFFDRRFATIFRRALWSQIPFAIVTAIACVILYPVVFFTYISERRQFMAEEQLLRFYREMFEYGIYLENEFIAGFVAVFLALITLASALAATSYMHGKRSVDFYHSLPVTRTQQLAANFLASYTAIAGTFLATYLFTMAVQIIGWSRFGGIDAHYFIYSALDIFAILTYIFVIWIFVALISANVSTVFDSLVVVKAIGLGIWAVYSLTGAVWSSFTYGAAFDGHSMTFSLILSPLLFFFARFSHPHPSIVILAWFLIGIGMLALATRCYNRRKSEIAGQTQPGGVFQIIVTCIVSFVAAVIFFLVFANFYTTTPGLFFIMLVSGTIIGSIAVLIFGRGVKNFLRGMRWPLLGSVVACVAFIAIFTDATGFIGRVPQVGQVVSVSTNYMGRFGEGTLWNAGITLTDPESIAIVTEMHRLAVSDPPHAGSNMARWRGNEERFVWNRIMLEYTLTSGRTMRRTFDVIDREALATLVALEAQNDFITQMHPIFNVENANDIAFISITDAWSASPQDDIRLETAQYAMLLEAIKSDMFAETLEEIKNPSQPAAGYIWIGVIESDEVISRTFGWNLRGHNSTAMFTHHPLYGNIMKFQVLITHEYTRTLALLDQLGLIAHLASPEIDTAYLLGAGELWGHTNAIHQVVTSIAMGARSNAHHVVNRYIESNRDPDLFSQSGWAIPVVSVTDPQEISQIVNASRSQLYNDDIWNTHVVVIIESGGELWWGTKYVPIEELPSGVRREVGEVIFAR